MKNEKVYLSIIFVLLMLSLSLNAYSIFLYKKVNSPKMTGFSFLDPTISSLEVDDFLKIKEEYTSSYNPLKAEIEKILSEADGHFGVYFEDLEFHYWIGINEKEDFKPASLLKITTVSAILKEIEEGELSLEQKVILKEEDLNQRFGDLYKREGSTFTIKELIEIALIYSDNTAVVSLHQFLLNDRWKEARLSMGLPLISVMESKQGVELTPKQFSNVFRSLYYSGYLSRYSSNWVLELLSETVFKRGITVGVPEDIKVSHKIGVWIEEGENRGSVHDCGIVYAEKPYILCIMSENTTTEEGNRVIEEISRTVYNYVSSSER